MMGDPTIRAYDRLANEYERVNARSIWTKQLDEFRSQLSGGRVLEIGCGTGRDAVPFIEGGYNYTGIDASQSMLDIARRRIPGAEFRLMDFYDLQFPAESFDGFLAIASLLHADRERVGGILESIGNILKPNGIGFVSMRMGQGEELRQKQGTRRRFVFYGSEEFEGVLETYGHQVMGSGETKEPDGTPWIYFFTRNLRGVR